VAVARVLGMIVSNPDGWRLPAVDRAAGLDERRPIGKPSADPKSYVSLIVVSVRSARSSFAEAWTQADVPEARKEVLHATYERIVVAGSRFVNARLTTAAHNHGLDSRCQRLLWRARRDSSARMPWTSLETDGGGSLLSPRRERR